MGSRGDYCEMQSTLRVLRMAPCLRACVALSLVSLLSVSSFFFFLSLLLVAVVLVVVVVIVVFACQPWSANRAESVLWLWMSPLLLVVHHVVGISYYGE